MIFLQWPARDLRYRRPSIGRRWDEAWTCCYHSSPSRLGFWRPIVRRSDKRDGQNVATEVLPMLSVSPSNGDWWGHCEANAYPKLNQTPTSGQQQWDNCGVLLSILMWNPVLPIIYVFYPPNSGYSRMQPGQVCRHMSGVNQDIWHNLHVVLFGKIQLRTTTTKKLICFWIPYLRMIIVFRPI
jgi:hypothetical protein